MNHIDLIVNIFITWRNKIAEKVPIQTNFDKTIISDDEITAYRFNI